MEIINSFLDSYHFPIFRGMSYFIIYQYLISFNIAGWNRYNIDYATIFRFQGEKNSAFSIFKIAVLFTQIWFLSILYYIVYEDIQFPILRNINKDIVPLIPWILFLEYLIVPVIFDSKGMKWIFGTLFESLVPFYFPNHFSKNFLVDQLISFVGPLKDLSYTICYYTSDINSMEQIYNCKNSSRNTILYIVLCPLILRCCQCIRGGYENGKFFNTANFYNFIKYFLSIVTVLVSFLSNFDKTWIYIWIFFACITTFYSYFWDIKMDWGFLNLSEGYLLRKEKKYGWRIIYIIASIMNLLFRLSWTLTLSTYALDTIGLHPELFIFMTAYIELLRRFIWNYFRVENQQIQEEIKLKKEK